MWLETGRLLWWSADLWLAADSGTFCLRHRQRFRVEPAAAAMRGFLQVSDEAAGQKAPGEQRLLFVLTAAGGETTQLLLITTILWSTLLLWGTCGSHTHTATGRWRRLKSVPTFTDSFRFVWITFLPLRLNCSLCGKIKALFCSQSF